jgi:hypothetical protein
MQDALNFTQKKPPVLIAAGGIEVILFQSLEALETLV